MRFNWILKDFNENIWYFMFANGKHRISMKTIDFQWLCMTNETKSVPSSGLEQFCCKLQREIMKSKVFERICHEINEFQWKFHKSTLKDRIAARQPSAGQRMHSMYGVQLQHDKIPHDSGCRACIWNGTVTAANLLVLSCVCLWLIYSWLV